MSTDIKSLDDIIESVNKNIKKVFQNNVRPENMQEAYIIGLKLTLDRLAQQHLWVKGSYDSEPSGSSVR
jgi:hypothetical protein